jgi:hypothetical protein
MNRKYLLRTFVGLFGISLAFNIYQAYESKTQTYSEQTIIYKRRITEAEEKARKNRENIRVLEKRIENLEKEISPNYYSKPNEYNLQRVL